MNAKITGSRFVLAVRDLQTSAHFYKEKMGFQTLWEGGGWHFLYRETTQIMIGECPDEMPASDIGCHSYFAYFEMEDVDAIFEEYRSKGVEIISKPENKDWGQREFAIRTVDGHRITLGEAILPRHK